MKLNLQLFGGGNSGSDGLGADRGSMKVSKVSYHGSAGSSGTGSAGNRGQMPVIARPMVRNGPDEKERNVKKTTSTNATKSGKTGNAGNTAKSSGEPVTRVAKNNDVYSIYTLKNGKETYLMDNTGTNIMNSGFSYNQRREAWTDRNGKKYVIRKKRR